jgi:L-serine kinase (ADP)
VSAPEFRLLPLEALKIHEQVVDAEVTQLVRALLAAGVVTEPIWVARDSFVILNGHHRYNALRTLQARFAPAWLVDYDDPEIELDRWGDGPPLTKPEVIQRAVAGKPYPPKTTRHRVRHPLPHHPTTLQELGVVEPAAHGRRDGASAR